MKYNTKKQPTIVRAIVSRERQNICDQRFDSSIIPQNHQKVKKNIRNRGWKYGE